MKVLVIIIAINIRDEVSLNYTALAVGCIDAYISGNIPPAGSKVECSADLAFSGTSKGILSQSRTTSLPGKN